MAKGNKYRELTKMVSFRIPVSMIDRVRNIVYLSIDKMQYEKANEVLDKEEVPVEVFKSVKEPTQTKFVPFTARKIMVEGYACLKDEDSEVCYWRDSVTTALVFDNEDHLKSCLIKFKP